MTVSFIPSLTIDISKLNAKVKWFVSKEDILVINSKEYYVSSSIKVDGTRQEASKWKLGFIQNVLTHNSSTIYSNINTKKITKRKDKNWQKQYLDAGSVMKPWYEDSMIKPFLHGRIYDGQPQTSMRDTVCSTIPIFMHKKESFLKSYSRKTKFVTWLVAEHPISKQFQYLYNIIWNIEFKVPHVYFDSSNTIRISSVNTDIRIVSQGRGKGQYKPVIHGPFANDVLGV